MNAPVLGCRSSDAIDAAGFAVVEGVLDERTCVDLARAAEAMPAGTGDDRRRGGVRDLFRRVPAVVELARTPHVRQLVEPVLGPGAFAVRAILFDKTPAANWKVAWHQDVTIAVAERRDAAGFGPWSAKDGVTHVRAPRDVLAAMLAVRLHLDDCGPENGALRVIPGSHRGGRLDPAAVPAIVAAAQPATCPVGRGGAMLMRPLLLHASSPAARPGHRRVIHIEFTAADLPSPLRWHERH